MESQGGSFIGLVSVVQHADERRMLRTEKSCGPDAPTLASSLRRRVPAQPGQTCRQSASDGGKQARSPGRARRKPLKPLRREGRVSRRTLGDYARVLHLISHARPRVHRAPGFPCALCYRRDKSSAKPRTHRAARMRSHIPGATSLREANDGLAVNGAHRISSAASLSI